MKEENLWKATRVVKPYVDLRFFTLHHLKLHHTLPLTSAAADRWMVPERKEEKDHGKIFNMIVKFCKISYGPNLNQDRIARIPILFGFKPFPFI